MNKVRELRIDSTLWATPSKIINLLDFKPEKISIKTESNTNNDMKAHHVRYENGGIYLTIDNIRGYFNFSNNLGTLTMLFADTDQQDKYHQVRKEIFKIINGGHGKLKLHEKIRLFYNDLPVEHVFKIPTITIVIKSLIEKKQPLSNPYFLLTGCLGNHFFASPLFPTQSVRLPLVTHPSQVLPTLLLPSEAEEFPRGDKYFKHVPSLTYLIYFSPKGYTQ